MSDDQGYLLPDLYQGLLQEKSVLTNISLVTMVMAGVGGRGVEKLCRKVLTMEAILLVFNNALDRNWVSETLGEFSNFNEHGSKPLASQ